MQRECLSGLKIAWPCAAERDRDGSGWGCENKRCTRTCHPLAVQRQLYADANTNDDPDGNDNDDHSNNDAVPTDDDGVPKPDKWMHGKLYHWDPFFGYTSSYN